MTICMNTNCIFVLSSVTYVMKAERLLASAGIYSTPVKTGEVAKVRGCGYGLALNDSGSNMVNCNKAKAIIERNGINILGVTEAKDR
ncbi:MAG: DUF3343 domain-containing protein [Eubacteriales bacterium]|nr:DUF3343 domain-containing protein [Eubacteriales bacterium]